MEPAYQYSKVGCVGGSQSRCGPTNLVSHCTFIYEVSKCACAIANDTVTKLGLILRLCKP